MNTAKREAQSLPMTDQKRRCEGIPSVKKVNFRRNSKTTDLAKGNEFQSNSNLKVKRSKKPRRRASCSSCSESEAGADEKNHVLPKMDVAHVDDNSSEHDKNPLMALRPSEQKNCCSTPVSSRGHGMQNCVPLVSESIRRRELSAGQHADSPLIGTPGTKSLVNNSSFYDDDVALASLNLSEIITSSCGTINVVEGADSLNSLKDAKGSANQFYGLPLRVKDLLHKFKGIETLYGKSW